MSTDTSGVAVSAAGRLLPPNATPLERRAAQALAWDVSSRMPADLVPTLWDANSCPAALLHILAWAESVDTWDATWPEERKRAVIKESRAIHRQKGTPAAIRRVLAALGHPDAEIMERCDIWQRDGTQLRNGRREHGGSLSWARFKVFLHRPVTIDQARQIRTAIMQVTRNCCHLAELNFNEAANRHNGTARRDGQYTRGIISDRSI
ncbi:phage tail protein I [Uliginosibacterium gangwonense]|uniref:phage tail protein I n=1 Tax=Uliginosibacterium gangwonense TaxID=392736 RepID=UPI0003696BA0|nr:phage tail protein I [Uliginosibacterium gangwonense]